MAKTTIHLYPSQKLAAKIAAKTLHADPAQAAIALRLDQLIDRLQTAALSRRKWPMVIRQMLGQDFGQPIRPDFATCASASQRAVYLWRGWPRQNHADGYVS
jgi:predicted ATPase